MPDQGDIGSVPLLVISDLLVDCAVYGGVSQVATPRWNELGDAEAAEPEVVETYIRGN